MTSKDERPERAAPRGVHGVARRVGNVIRQIIGAPDYDAYLAHVKAHHPGQTPLTENEFRRERLGARYSKPGNRCC